MDELSVRVSDADRDGAATALGDHAAAGRLTLDELTERLDRVYAARTREELDAVAADLPAVADAEPPAPRAKSWIVAIMSGASRRGRWRLAADTRVLAVMGGAELDLRGAELAGTEAVLTCIAFMGGIDVIVPDGVEVEVSGFALMGGRDERVEPVPRRLGTPRLHVRAYAVMGGVSVRNHRPRRGRRG